ncbi:HAD family phosphatase [Collinsella tanakaei]|uniref:HAD family hydrolase n=1 Tax=Collinsella tanakaei TaxID=626935 RepID=UPI0029422974|nr:HAD family phosphatase [Collinsella tanakaei]
MADKTFPYKAVIFDMDGVIVDTEAYYQREQRRFVNEMGLNVSDREILDLVGQSHQTFQRVLADWWSRAGRELTLDAAEQTYRDWEALHPCDYKAILNPGVADTIDELRSRGVRVALASSSPMDSILAVLEACDLSDKFELIVSGKDFHESKPNPAIYLYAIEKLDLDASECCCIEDSVPGIAAGKAAGLTVFAKREDRFGFSQDRADAIIDQIPDILGIA